MVRLGGRRLRVGRGWIGRGAGEEEITLWEEAWCRQDDYDVMGVTEVGLCLLVTQATW